MITVTVNGVPLQTAMRRMDAEAFAADVKPAIDLATSIKTRAMKKVSGYSLRNHSGARSGRCKILFSALRGGN